VTDYRCVYKQRRALVLEKPQDVIQAVNAIIRDSLGVKLQADTRDSTRKGRKAPRKYVLVQLDDMTYFNFQSAPGARERCAEMLSGNGPPKRASADGDEDAGPCAGEVFDAEGDSGAVSDGVGGGGRAQDWVSSIDADIEDGLEMEDECGEQPPPKSADGDERRAPDWFCDIDADIADGLEMEDEYGEQPPDW
jgi:hypothetical protein